MRSFYYITFFLFSFTLHAQNPPSVPGFGRKKDPIPRELDSMYLKGLKFLQNTQSKEGHWPTDNTYGSYPGVVGLSLLSFLAYGEDPNHGPFADNIKRSIDYIINLQGSNGYIGSNVKSDSGGNMYNHGFATLALAEAYGMVDDPRLGPALKKAVNLSLEAQKRNSRGAWRYHPNATDADSTLAGCIIVSLYAAKNAGIAVPEENLTKALKYMDSCRSKSTGGYGYTRPNGERPALTAIGSLCFSLAKQKDNDGYKKSLQYLKTNINHREVNYPFYFEYYMSQALFHADTALWEEWNKKNIKFLKTLQNSDGSIAGPSPRKGKTFSTAANLLSLALNYRFLPIYEK